MQNGNGPRPWVPPEIGIGIDFGMTYSGAALVIPAPDGSLILDIVPADRDEEDHSVAKFPTVVFVPNNQQAVVVGRDAYMDQRPGRIYELFKQKLGTAWRDAIVPNATFLAKEVLIAVKRNIDAELLRRGFLRNDAIKKRYVFSYPGTWTEAAQHAYSDAIRDAGFPMADVAMVDEAIATAIAIVRDGNHPEMLNDQRPIFICDFGGGTTDFALVRAENAGFIRMAHPVDGHPTLGMSNLDKLVALKVAEKAHLLQPSGQQVFTDNIVCGVGLETAWDDFDVNSGWKSVLLTASERYKLNAFPSWPSFSSDTLFMRDGRHQLIAKYEIQPLVDKMLTTLYNAAGRYLTEIELRRHISAGQIGFIAIGGGGSALPNVAAPLKQLMPAAQVLNIQPDKATSLVQRGAAYHAFNPFIYDRRAAKSYGIKAFKPKNPENSVGRTVPQEPAQSGVGNKTEAPAAFYPYYHRYIHRGAVIIETPITDTFTPIRTDTNLITIYVLCGENDDPLLNEEVGSLTLTLPLMPSTEMLTYPITCAFTINNLCVLHVAVKGRNGEHIESTFTRGVDTLP